MIRPFHTVIALGLFAFVGCAPLTIEEANSPVALEPRGIQSVCNLAVLHLGTIEDSRAWIDAAVEVAAALHVCGNSNDAVALLDEALSRTQAIEDPEQRAIGLIAIANAILKLENRDDVYGVLASIRDAASAVTDEHARWDLLGRANTALAMSGHLGSALETTREMPESNSTLASFKARTLHDIAPIQAQSGDLDGALTTLRSITMGLAYYRPAASSDVAIAAFNQGQSGVASDLLQSSDTISRAQSDGYFIAGALRHIAVAYAAMGNEGEASNVFADALNEARKAESPQHQARAMSRVATSLSDVGFFDKAVATLPAAVEIAEHEPRDPFRFWAFYEIAGAAAFSGDFSTANRLVDLIPPTFQFGSRPLKAATQRDVAWGLARHSRHSDAVELALRIDVPRERVQALSRIVQVLANPDMHALPRYL